MTAYRISRPGLLKSWIVEVSNQGVRIQDEESGKARRPRPKVAACLVHLLELAVHAPEECLILDPDRDNNGVDASAQAWREIFQLDQGTKRRRGRPRKGEDPSDEDVRKLIEEVRDIFSSIDPAGDRLEDWVVNEHVRSYRFVGHVSEASDWRKNDGLAGKLLAGRNNLSDLARTDSDVRNALVAALASRETRGTAIGALYRLAHHKNVRDGIIKCLAEARPLADDAPVEERFKENGFLGVARDVLVFGFSDPSVRAAVVDRLSDGPPHLRLHLLNVIARRGGASSDWVGQPDLEVVVRAVGSLLRDPDGEVRREAIRVLGSFCHPRTKLERAPYSWAFFMNDKERGEDRFERWRARYEGRDPTPPSVIEAILGCVNHDDPSTRMAAVRVLGIVAHESPTARQKLLPLLNDETLDVRRLAIEALGEAVDTDNELRIALLRIMGNRDEASMVRAAAAKALKREVRCAEVAEALHLCRADPDEVVASAGVEAWSEGRNEASQRELIEAFLAGKADLETLRLSHYWPTLGPPKKDDPISEELGRRRRR